MGSTKLLLIGMTMNCCMRLLCRCGVFWHLWCSGGDAKERYKCVDSRAPQLVRAINMFEDFLDFFFSRSFLIVLLLTALFPTRLALFILSDSPISSSLLLQNQKDELHKNRAAEHLQRSCDGTKEIVSDVSC